MKCSVENCNKIATRMWDLTQDVDHQSYETKSWLEKVICGR